MRPQEGKKKVQRALYEGHQSVPEVAKRIQGDKGHIKRLILELIEEGIAEQVGTIKKCGQQMGIYKLVDGYVPPDMEPAKPDPNDQAIDAFRTMMGALYIKKP